MRWHPVQIRWFASQGISDVTLENALTERSVIMQCYLKEQLIAPFICEVMNDHLSSLTVSQPLRDHTSCEEWTSWSGYQAVNIGRLSAEVSLCLSSHSYDFLFAFFTISCRAYRQCNRNSADKGYFQILGWFILVLAFGFIWVWRFWFITYLMVEFYGMNVGRFRFNRWRWNFVPL